MKFDQNSNTLFTNSGQFIKKMNCPKNINWDNMKKTNNVIERICDICNKVVFDTEFLKDEEVLFLAKKDSKSCFRVNFSISK
jgi:hypothetical protein